MNSEPVLRWSALGVGWELRIGPVCLRAPLRELFAAFRPSSSTAHRIEIRESPPATRGELLVDGNLVEKYTALNRLLESLVHHLDLHTARDAKRLLMHAGAAERDGVVVVMPGSSGAGKSTLTAGLVRAGFRYVSDEIVAIEPETQLIEPYPRPLVLSPGSWSSFSELEDVAVSSATAESPGSWFVPPRRLGQVAQPSPMGLVVLPTYRPERATSLEPVSRASALYDLCNQTLYFDRCARVWLDLLGEIVREVDCYRLTTCDVGEAVESIAGLFERRRSQQHHPG